MDPQRITHFKLCPSCGKQMRPIRASEIYECKECRVFVTEAVRESDAKNNTTGLERYHS